VTCGGEHLVARSALAYSVAYCVHTWEMSTLRLRYFALNDSRNNVISGSRLSAECACVATKQRMNVEA